MIEIQYTDPTDGQALVRQLSFEDEPFTVGRDESCTVSLPPTDLSRYALIIAERSGGRLVITGSQRFGHVRVVREDGTVKATLRDDEEFICGAGTYRVTLTTPPGPLVDVEVVATGRQRRPVPGAVTTGVWSRRQVFDPTPEDDWRWFAVLATVLAQTRSKHHTRDLGLLAKAWHGGEWQGNVQGKLDKIIERMGLRPTGRGKAPDIATEVLSSGVLPAEEYEDFRDQVQRRALASLTRAEIGALGWGRLARGLGR